MREPEIRVGEVEERVGAIGPRRRVAARPASGSPAPGATGAAGARERSSGTTSPRATRTASSAATPGSTPTPDAARGTTASSSTRRSARSRSAPSMACSSRDRRDHGTEVARASRATEVQRMPATEIEVGRRRGHETCGGRCRDRGRRAGARSASTRRCGVPVVRRCRGRGAEPRQPGARPPPWAARRAPRPRAPGATCSVRHRSRRTSGVDQFEAAGRDAVLEHRGVSPAAAASLRRTHAVLRARRARRRFVGPSVAHRRAHHSGWDNRPARRSCARALGLAAATVASREPTGGREPVTPILVGVRSS